MGGEKPGEHSAAGLCHPLLDACGVQHSFGVRDAQPQPAPLRPVQVHGCVVAEAQPDGRLAPAEADAVVSRLAGVRVGIVTADCVPILACSESGEVVAAIHAGWRGLAAGVVEAGIATLRRRAPSATRLVAVIGPHIGSCCYEVDDPVVAPLRERYGDALDDALEPSRPGHAMLDLAAATLIALGEAGIPSKMRGQLPAACTFCQPQRFHSYRRDGPRSGRLVHVISAT